MNKVIKEENLSALASELHDKKLKIVLAGGCFDVLHIGHVRFLKNAKKEAEILMVLIESDESIKKLKGKDKPINRQKERAELVASLGFVDYVILLEGIKNDSEYDKIVSLIRPSIIAVTLGDPAIAHKKRQAELTGAKIRAVIYRIENKSTSDLIRKNE